MRRRDLPAAARRGLALIAVLWIVAAAAIIITGISHSVKQELKMVSTARDAVVGDGIGQAAIFLALQEMTLRNDPPQRLVTLTPSFRGTPVAVQVLPLHGLVDVNNAPAGLLAALFQHAGGLERQRAVALADAAVAFRARKDGAGRPVGFESPEDLLQVPGIDYPLYARLATLVTADVQGGGRVNVPAAPADVLMVLAGGDAPRAAALAAARDASQPGLDTTSLPPDFIELQGQTQRYRMQARVPLASGAWLLVSRTVDLGGSRHGVPWRVLHADHRFEPATGH